MRYTVDLEAMHVELLSAEERNAQHPETFPIPSRAARESLEPGEIVKLLFCYTGDPEEDFVERMWVIVESRDKHGRYVGVLDNDPIDIPDLEAGMALPFTAEHIIDIDEETMIEGFALRPTTWREKLRSIFRRQ